MEGLPTLAIALASSAVLGVAIIGVFHKMVDGDLSVAPGLVAVVTCLMLLLASVRPPHPALPFVVMVVVVSLMAFSPFAAEQLASAEHLNIGTSQLDKAFQTLAAKPDNIVAQLQIASGLHAHGYRAHAIAIARNSLSQVSQVVDEVQNRSPRELFRREDVELSRWERLAQEKPPRDGPLACQGCGHLNPIEAIACTKCGRTYLLDYAHKATVMPKVWGKLVVAWSVVALLVVSAGWIGLTMQGWKLSAAMFAALLVVAAMFRWLFADRS